MDAVEMGMVLPPLVLQNPCPGVLNGAPANLFFALINSLFAAQCSLAPPLVEDYGIELTNGDKFDFIVVGCGTTGSVVANRLSENPNWRVLVLEAGGDPSITTQIPGLWPYLIGTSEDWSFKTEPQKEACKGFNAQVCQIPAGKVLGGSSSINVMTYIRGNEMDYNNWQKLGNSGWGWSTVFKYFKKSEDNSQFGNETKYHSTGGYLKVGPISYASPIKNVLKRAVSELGYSEIEDLNRRKWIGYGDSQGFVLQGTRYSSYKAFIYPVKERPNLFIAKHAFVTKVLIDDETKTAYGVEVEINDTPLTIHATKEVVLSAGALNTPKILMLSGIGPWDHLKEMDIPIQQNLPVGQNLQDHVSFIGFFVALNPNDTKWKDNSKNGIDNIYKYFLYRKGRLATIGLTSFYGFINCFKRKAKYPNIQLHHEYFEKGLLQTDPTFIRSFGICETTSKRIINVNNNYALLFISPTLLNPKSRGHVQLRSDDPFAPPRIFAKYLTEECDIKTLLASIKYLKKLVKTKEMSKYKPEFVDIELPGCSNFKFNSNAYYTCALKYMSMSGFHPCGTAKMGRDLDETAVVNPRLQVRGIKSLRVADGSIMPKIISGNTEAACIMIGEKASDMVKEDYPDD